MPANGTNQSMLRRIQGGSPTSQGMNERAQRATRNTAPNTTYNTRSNDNMYGYNAYASAYNPFGMYGAGGQYGNQQSNLGRYQPPTYGGNQQGPYAYNLPNAYGSTGMNYMSGFGQMGIPFNPFMGAQNPQQNFGNQDQRAQMSQQGSGGGMWGQMGQQYMGNPFMTGTPDMSALQNRMQEMYYKPQPQQGPSRSFMSGGVEPISNRGLTRQQQGQQVGGQQMVPGMMDYGRNNMVQPQQPSLPSNSPLNWWGG